MMDGIHILHVYTMYIRMLTCTDSDFIPDRNLCIYIYKIMSGEWFRDDRLGAEIRRLNSRQLYYHPFLPYRSNCMRHSAK